MISLKFRSSTVLKLTRLVSFELALACHLIISLWFVPRIFKIVNYGLKFAWSIRSLLFSDSFLGNNRRTMNRIRWKCVINVLWPKHLSQKKEKRPACVGTIDFQKKSVRFSASQGLMSRTFRKTQTFNPEKIFSPKRRYNFLRYSINIKKVNIIKIDILLRRRHKKIMRRNQHTGSYRVLF